MLSRSSGRYTPAQINRVGAMSGVFGRTVHQEIQRAMGMSSGSTSTKKRDTYGEDVRKLVKEIHGRELFKYVPNRHHKGFKEFNRQQYAMIRSPEQFANKLMSHSADMDFWRYRSLNLARNAAQN